MQKNIYRIFGTIIFILTIFGNFTFHKGHDHLIQVVGEGNGLPSLKVTWDFSTSTGTNSTAFSTATLKTFLEGFDSPSSSYTILSTNNNYKGSGDGTDQWPDNNWKFSSKDINVSASITGLPSFAYVKIWAQLWATDIATLTIKGGTSQNITDNTQYKLYEFDVSENSTTFKINAVKRLMIVKVEFWGC